MPCGRSLELIYWCPSTCISFLLCRHRNSRWGFSLNFRWILNLKFQLDFRFKFLIDFKIWPLSVRKCLDSNHWQLLRTALLSESQSPAPVPVSCSALHLKCQLKMKPSRITPKTILLQMSHHRTVDSPKEWSIITLAYDWQNSQFYT